MAFPQIPGYKILSKLAEGGMAAVYLGVQENLKRNVAIKILDPSSLKVESAAVRFDKESETAAGLSHSNIVQIFDKGIVEDYHYIVMEYLEESLSERMKRSPDRKLDPEIALEIVKEILNALDYAHFRGVYHRDIKPENIMFKQDNKPVLVDFGIARVFDSSDHLTRTGMGLGTVYYMSPEQCMTQKDIDGRADIYSLGVVLYEMLTGKKPYNGESVVTIALKHVKDPVPLLPSELILYQPLINKMMAKNRDNRISNGAQFKEILDRIIHPANSSNTSKIHLPSPPSPPSPPIGEHHDKFDNIGKIDNLDKMDPIDNINDTEPELLLKNYTAKINAKARKRVTILKWVGVIAAVAIIGLLLVFLLGKGTKPAKKNSNGKSAMASPRSDQTQPSGTQSGDPQDIEFQQEFQQKYNLILHFIENKRLENAERLLKDLKKIKVTQEVNELEEKIRLLNLEFKQYMDQIYASIKKKDFQRAKMALIQAKKIKITDELSTLEDSIDSNLRNRNR
ncbi:MAG: serine/threonine protein kinase [Candidatus Omnitrophota bacterium]